MNLNFPAKRSSEHANVDCTRLDGRNFVEGDVSNNAREPTTSPMAEWAIADNQLFCQFHNHY